MIGAYQSTVFGAVEVSEEAGTLSLHWVKTHALVPVSETSFRYMEDEDSEVHFENRNEQGTYERLRVIQPFFWFTAERVEHYVR